MLRWLAIVPFLFLISCAEPPQEEPLPAEIPPREYTTFSLATSSKLEAHFDSLFRTGRFNGVAFAFSNDSILSLARGFRSMRTKDSLRTTDAFQLASVSKPLTAYATLQLVDQGRLHLDDLVAQHLEGFPYSNVTIRMLLNHTSGLGNYTYMTDSLWGMPDSIMTNDDLLREFIAGHIPVYYTPGKTFDYCNSNYTLLASIIDCTMDMDMRDYMQFGVFDPLQMNSTSLIGENGQTCLDYDVHGHYPNGKHKLPFYLDGIIGDKGVYSTVEDLFHFYQEWKDPQFVSASLLQQSFENPVRTREGRYYALGWRMKENEKGEKLIFHNGWWRGFRTYFWWSEKDDKCFIALTNTIRGGYLNAEEIIGLY